ncbi:MAG: endopeptidase La [Enterobacteriaceae bacterium]
MKLEDSKKIKIPVLPLRDVVVYPNMVIPLFVGREKSIKCLEFSMNNNKKVMLVAQKEASKDEPSISDLFLVGTISSILQMLKLPDGTLKVLVEGISRAKIIAIADNGNYFTASAIYIRSSNIEKKDQEILIRTAINQFEDYIKLNKKIPQEVLSSLKNINEITRLIDTIAAHMPLKLLEKQSVLETEDISKRLEYLMLVIESEIEMLNVEKKIRNRVKSQMEKSQREYYLNEQIKALQKELGEIDNIPDEYESIKKKIKEKNMSKEAKEKTMLELKKLKMMSPISAEATVVRSYIDWMISLPWNKSSRLRKDISIAKKILDKDHYGLEKVKDHIIEYLAVQNRVNKVKGPILCLVGPPGVGKTSLGQSIAKATGRKYTRMALGGLRDEAEIRGHRRTYIGSMPGKLIQKISKIGVKNPLFLLDEVDKISSDMRGDPASALLEVLDPEQNFSFNDHYLEIDYDLSNVMFVATSNSMNIPHPLLDRMEIIRLSGYTEEEKLNIAIKHLVPKQLKQNALKPDEINIEKEVIVSLIRYYTREAGVRNLQREISKLCRKTVKILLLKKKINRININLNNLKKFLGVKKFDYGKASKKVRIGQVTGLAWTEVGGDLLTIEAVCIPGKGKLIYTGSLGEVMQESIQAALTVIRSRSNIFNIKENFYEKNDIHVHVPEGATPKDGPSAGIAVCTAIFSCLTNKKIKSNIAMTGEITLYGKILPIGGLKEKLLAAHRGMIKTVIIPYENKRNLEEISKDITGSLNIKLIKKIEEIFNIVFEN